MPYRVTAAGRRSVTVLVALDFGVTARVVVIAYEAKQRVI
jgi:hypothetical protein